MEDDFTDNWSCVGGCTLETSTDSYTGALSAKLSNRLIDFPLLFLSHLGMLIG